MSQNTIFGREKRILLWAVLLPALLVLPALPLLAGLAGLNGRAVGGIIVDADGVVQQATDLQRQDYLNALRDDLQKAVPELSDPAALRKVSLRGLENAIAESLASNRPLPDEVRLLAGLQRIQYVLVYPDRQDIVLAGPGEGWKVADDGSIVGVTTGRPTLLLDDLVVALRTVQAAKTEGISVSIDPTDEGRRRYDQSIAQLRTSREPVSRELIARLAETMGPQQITYSGVPANTHFGRVLLAADHRMKRYAMKLEESPVPGLTSYLDLLRATRQTGSPNPRWWMACNYEPLARSEDRLAWELRGPGVKAMTENEFVAQDGTVQGTGKADPIAKRWADQLTANYDQLVEADPVFGALRNVMDMCVVAALIQREDLAGLAGSQGFPLLSGADSQYQVEPWFAPQAISTQCSHLVIDGRPARHVITASGGVQIESWQVASQQQVQPQVGEVREKASRTNSTGWWWN